MIEIVRRRYRAAGARRLRGLAARRAWPRVAAAAGLIVAVVSGCGGDDAAPREAAVTAPAAQGLVNAAGAYVATWETTPPTNGTITAGTSYVATHVDDTSYEQLNEARTSSATPYRLVHTWKITDITGVATGQLKVIGSKLQSGGDTFAVTWAPATGTGSGATCGTFQAFQPACSLSAVASAETTCTTNLTNPTNVICVRVTDSATSSDTTLNRVRIDHVGLTAIDVTAPGAVTTLAATATGATTVTLSFAAPGDDGAVGTATSYEVRRSTAPITSANWTSATVVAGAPAPQPAGTSQTVTVTGLTASTPYYFALKATDEAGHVSALSNVATATTPAVYAVTYTLVGSGGGSVTSAPAGLSCAASCTATFVSGTVVTLTATPTPGWRFTGWSGAGGCTGTSTCALTMTAARAVTATFTPEYVLTYGRAGSGAGTVTSAPVGIACGASCAASFASGTTVTLTADASPDSVFVGWTGACVGSGPCVVTMSGAQSVTATYQATYALAVTVTGPGQVTSSPSGVDCTGACSTPLIRDTVVTLTATPTGSAVFLGWSGACAGVGPCQVTMASAQAVGATFAPTFSLGYTKSGAGAGTVRSAPAGLDCSASCAAAFVAGTAVALTPTPSPGSAFVGWSGACSGAGACVVTMNAAQAVAATFTPTFTLDYTKAGNGAGTVTSAPAGLTCTGTCSQAFVSGTMVTLTAQAAAGSAFIGWSGTAGCVGAATCTVDMIAARAVTATFQQTFSLSYTRTGAGVGTVSSSPAGLDCADACISDWIDGTVVTLTAQAGPGARFAGWSGACRGTDPCTVTMSAAHAVTATFRPVLTLAYTAAGAGGGVVVSTPAGILCVSDCTHDFDSDTVVTLVATASPGSVFAGWSGACNGTGDCAVTMDAARNVTATFDQTFTLAYGNAGLAGGTVSSTPGGIDCADDCTAVFLAGTALRLVATPGPGAVFMGWSGDCAGTGPCDVAMTADRSFLANFSPGYTLTYTKAGAGSGAVDTSADLHCVDSCAATVLADLPLVLTATPAPGSVFTGWSGACAGTGSCALTMSDHRAVTATFQPVFALSYTRFGAGVGWVRSTPAGIECVDACAHEFFAGDTVTLTATAEPRSRFIGWSGACTGTGPCTVVMSQARGVAATFASTAILTYLHGGEGEGRVVSTPAAVDCAAACDVEIVAGTEVTLTAVPGPNAAFAGWTGACVGTGPCTLTMNADVAVTATFVPRFTLTYVKGGAGTGTVRVDPVGLDCASGCAPTVDAGTVLTLTATAAPGSLFTGWSGGCSGTAPCAVVMSAATTVTATFEPSFVLTFTKAGTGSGGAVSNPVGINCDSVCSYAFAAGSTVTLDAGVAAGTALVGWSGACTGTGPCVVTMTSDLAVTGTFGPGYTLTYSKAGAGPGTVASSPPGIDCAASCAYSFATGAVVTLTATAGPGGVFTGWSGSCTGTGNCTVTMSAARSVTATFAQTYPLTYTKAGSGTGSVVSSPAGIDCSGDCAAWFTANASVTLTATAAAGSVFTGWSGACAGTSTCTVTMSAARSVVANFVEGHPLTYTKVGTPTGSVVSSPAGLNCTASCTGAFSAGTVVTLTATATGTTSVFSGWSGAGCTGTGPCVVTMSAAQAVTATFVSGATLTYTKSGTGPGTVSSVPAGIDCAASCVRAFLAGAVVRLTATESAGGRFTGWGGACASWGANPFCDVTMSVARSVSATFATTYTLDYTKAGTGVGTIDSNPIGLSCGDSCQGAFVSGTSVTLYVGVQDAAEFAGWSGACTGKNLTCTIAMTANKAVTARFVPAFRINYTKAGDGAGAVVSNPTGINCGSDCTYAFASGTTVTLTATAQAGSVFTGWSGAGGCTGAGTCVVTMTEARDVTATFAPSVSLAYTKAGTGAGTVVSSPAGVNCTTSCTRSFGSGSQVTLTATAAAGAIFTGWSGAGGCTGTDTCTVTLSIDDAPSTKAVTATFMPLYTLTYSRAGGGGGSVVSSPAGIDCAGSCTASFASGTVVTLVAAPAPGSVFAGWSGHCGGTGACVVTMAGARTVTATFAFGFQLSYAKAGAGAGTVTSVPAGINCTDSCTHGFVTAAVVALTATPAPGSVFTGWSGACTGTSTCNVTIAGDLEVQATFTPKVRFIYTEGGSGGGVVAASVAPVACYDACEREFVDGTTETFTATADSGSMFVGWSGACSGTGPCVVTFAGDQVVTATFAQLHTLTYEPYDRELAAPGTVISTPAGIDCTATCAQLYPDGTVVTLRAVPPPGSVFAGWSGTAGCAGTGLCTVTIAADVTVLAAFSPEVRLTYTRGGAGHGVVMATPTGVQCDTDCSVGYAGTAGTVVILTATAAPDSVFTGWSGACTGAAACTVTMDVHRAVTATFAPRITLSYARSGAGEGTVVSTPAGLACAAACARQFASGTTITLTAAAAAGSVFTGWSGACTGTSTCELALAHDIAVSATFAPTVALSYTKAGGGGGTARSVPTGIACDGACTSRFALGEIVTLTATPHTGATFAGWSGSCSGVGPCVVTMNAATAVTATFASAPTVTLAHTNAGAGNGTVASSPGGLACSSGTCAAAFTSGAAVTLTAIAAVGSVFTGWSGACAGTGPCMLTMSVDRSTTATFARVFELTYTKLGAGDGTVTSAPVGLACVGDCSALFVSGTVVTLAAAPAPGWVFGGWSGAGCSGTGSCVVTMSAARSVTATFVGETIPPAPVADLDAWYGADGAVRLTWTAPGDDGGVGVAAVYDLRYAASPITAATFAAAQPIAGLPAPHAAGWAETASAASIPPGGRYYIALRTVDDAGNWSPLSNVAAVTTASQTLSYTKGGDGAGQVSLDLGRGQCADSCELALEADRAVTLIATPGYGARFVGWSGGCSGTATCTLTMSAARQVTAAFAWVTNHLTVGTTGTGAGTIASPDGIACGAVCAKDYAGAEAEVELTATPAWGSTLVGWTGWAGAADRCGASRLCATNVRADRSFVARFDATPITRLRVSLRGQGSVSIDPLAITVWLFDYEADVASGTPLTLTATPSPGWSFTGWSGPCSGVGPCVLGPGSSSADVMADFAPAIGVMVVKTGRGEGTVTAGPTAIDCGRERRTCPWFGEVGDVVTLTAAAAPDHVFVGWSGACAGTDACVVAVASSHTAVARFAPAPVAFAMHVAGSGSGSVFQRGTARDWITDAAASFTREGGIELVAEPATEASRLVSLSAQGGVCTASRCSYAVGLPAGAPASPVDVTAEFAALVGHTVHVDVAPAGTGTVVSTPAGISCAGSALTAGCVASFAQAELTISAAPIDGWALDRWHGGDCDHALPTCQLRVFGDEDQRVDFVPAPALTITVTGPGAVTSVPDFASCAGSCVRNYPLGATVTLVPHPSDAFLGWTGACTGLGPCVVAMTTARSVGASFAPAYTLTVTRTGTGQGTVRSTPAGIDCGPAWLDCSGSFASGRLVVLTATASSGSTFAGWTGAGCSGTGTCAVAMDADTAVAASFVPAATAVNAYMPQPPVAIPPAPPPVDLSQYPVDDHGGPILAQSNNYYLTERPPDALTALSECTAMIVRCADPTIPGHSIDACAVSPPRCTTSQPWHEAPCCPTACVDRYEELRIAHVAPIAAFRQAFYGRPSCAPGVELLLGGAP